MSLKKILKCLFERGAWNDFYFLVDTLRSMRKKSPFYHIWRMGRIYFTVGGSATQWCLDQWIAWNMCPIALVCPDIMDTGVSFGASEVSSEC